MRPWTLSAIAFVACALIGSASHAEDSAAPSDVTREMQSVVEEMRGLAEELDKETSRTLKEAIVRYEQATDAAAKLEAATILGFFEAALADPAHSGSTMARRLSARDRDVLTRAAALAAASEAQVAAFEAGLSKAEREAVTADLPFSLARTSGRFSLDMEAAACPKKAYQALRAKLGFGELARYGVSVSTLAGLYEDLNRPSYQTRLLRLIERKRCSTEACAAAQISYRLSIKRMSEKAWREGIDRSIAIGEADLAARKVQEAEMKPLVLRLATMSPECLSQISIPLVDHVTLDLTVERGRFLHRALQSLPVADPNTFDWAAIPLTAGDPVRESVLDGWGNAYVFERDATGKKLRLVSGGPDGQFGTTDDVAITGDP